ncbi:MAG: TolC family protein [Candidatus Neomarinimicrobiota bacterium]|nr:TolC family protein [Candidatus Neomarinimicrobiota bacterium]MEC9448192.1 TolC family protein [Candidatus Neomarinimicrobiota bacterium]|tara:strand:- start:592 stop:1908 length:1317 start_codon:yes stop_codon:yes gene_type:complete
MVKKLLVLLSFSIVISQTYSLNESVQVALENKETLKASVMDLQTSKQNVKESYSTILPSLRFSSSMSESQFPQQTGGYNPSSGEIILDQISSITSASSNISLSQNIYDGGVWWNTIRQAKNSYKISEEYNRQIKTNIIKGVHSAYFNYLKAAQLLDVSRSNLMSAQQQLSLAEQRFKLGSSKKTDFLKAEVRFGQARVDLVNNDAALQNAYMNLKNSMGLIGKNIDFSVEEVEAPMEIIPEFETGFTLLQKSNPSVKAKQYQITAAEINEKIAKGARMPNISANTSVSGSSDNIGDALSNSTNEKQRINTGLSISIPIFSGNSISTRIQKAKISVDKQQSEYLTQLQDLSVQLRYTLDRLKNYEEIIPINETVLESAEEDLKLAQVRYSQGSTTILEVLDSQVSVQQARSSLIRSKYDAYIEQTNLKALLGSLDLEYK